jgi:hypothetical protein
LTQAKGAGDESVGEDFIGVEGGRLDADGASALAMTELAELRKVALTTVEPAPTPALRLS